MANTKSAQKRIRQNERRRERNRAAKSRMRSAVKSVRNALESGDVETAEEQLPRAIEVIDRTAGKGMIHRNTAARTKSRLVKAVRAARADSGSD